MKLCILTGLTPVHLKLKEIAIIHQVKGSNNYETHNVDHIVNYKNWTHPAKSVEILETRQGEEYTYEIYTDGSKSDEGVGSGIAMFRNQALTHQMKFRLYKTCSNNQAEQLAIMKALDSLKGLNIREVPVDERKVAIYTDSKITLDSLKNKNNHKYLIEEIRNKLKSVEEDNWTVKFSWVKAHAGIYGNELADRLAKQAARDSDLQTSYDRIPISAVKKQLATISEEIWEREWESTTKGNLTKSFFPKVSVRLKKRIPMSSNLTTLVTGHGNINAYFHRFRIKDSAMCVCGVGEQTVDHVIYDCIEFKNERKTLANFIHRSGERWPIDKDKLANKYTKQLIKFANSIDLGKLQ